ncbi:MAG: EAL domain-containing protein, partial [Qipengyuania sp.]
TRDPLTRLADIGHVRSTMARWQLEWRGTEYACPMHLMLISLGRIETVNVAFGETAGDGALVEVAQRIRHFAADELESGVWQAARVSGGSFLLAAREECSRERWQWLGEALADAIATPISSPDMGASVRLSPRLVLLRATEGDTPDAMLDHLAEGLRRLVKVPGKRLAWTSGELAQSGLTHHQLEADLLSAIDSDEIQILFQPQYSCGEDRLVGAEALARWQHPQLGRVGAGTLFTIAERADHVAQLSRHVAKRALEAAARWREGLRLSINVTPADLAAGSFARDFLALVAQAGVSPESLTLEITEQVLLAELERVSEVLSTIREAGISLALDDFGAGFCNFHYLKILPIDAIKLDHSMVEGIVEEPRDLAVFRAIVAMARALDLKVVAEGIENEAQLEIVTREGCATYQGFLRSEPVTSEEFARLSAE